MAKNFTLTGVANLLNIGKGNANVKGTSSTQLQVRDNADAAFANMAGADPITNDDFTTKRYVDNLANGLNWLQSVDVATTGPGTLATDFENGDTVDGVVLVTGMRILIKDQASGVENGVYIVQASGAPVRAADMAAGSSAAADAMFVQQGTANADTAWVCTNDSGSDVVGTDALTFVNFASVTAGVTSIGNAVGITGTSVIQSGSAPVPTLYAIAGESGVLSTALVGSDVVVSVVTGGITTGKIADNAITEAKLAAGVAVLYRTVVIQASDFPAAPGSTTVNIGAVMPANAVTDGGKILVSTAFDNSPGIDVGDAGDPDAILAQTEIIPGTIDTYESSRMVSYSASTQLIATLTTGATQPTVGVARILVPFVRHT